MAGVALPSAAAIFAAPKPVQPQRKALGKTIRANKIPTTSVLLFFLDRKIPDRADRST